MVKRDLQTKIRSLAKQFPVVGIFGPRQSGKTTLAQMAFPKYTYISLEDIKAKELATNDPYSFFDLYHNKHGIILDEIQTVPSLFSYLQTWVDKHKRPGYFIITGSQNFLLNQAVTQTLAGRIAITTLLPFAVHELVQAKLLSGSLDRAVFRGGYPRIYTQKTPPSEWYQYYIRTYVERDIRQLKNVVDLEQFQKFIGLCAGRVGQILNVSSLANDCGVTVVTAKSWLSLLQASYIIFLLQPYHKNFSKRLIKSPKLFFYDTGLACSLLGIDEPEQLTMHYLRGGLTESFIVSEVLKISYNQGREPRCYFWRDNMGREIDAIVERGGRIIRLEIKASKTISANFFDNLTYWNQLAKRDVTDSYVIYAGNETYKRQTGNIVGWKDITSIFK